MALFLIGAPLFARPMQETDFNQLRRNPAALAAAAVLPDETPAPAAVEIPADTNGNNDTGGREIRLVIKQAQGIFIIEQGDHSIRLPLNSGLAALNLILQRLEQSESEARLFVKEEQEELLITGNIQIRLPLNPGLMELNYILQRLEGSQSDLNKIDTFSPPR
jgi:hypothetical protein